MCFAELWPFGTFWSSAVQAVLESAVENLKKLDVKLKTWRISPIRTNSLLMQEKKEAAFNHLFVFKQ